MGSKKETMGRLFSAPFRPTTILFPTRCSRPFQRISRRRQRRRGRSPKADSFGLIRHTPIMVFVQCPRSLEASLRSFQRQRPVHDILGGGIVANVILWRRKDVTLGILLGALSSWVLFEVAGYTVVSLVSNVLLLLFSILFVWTKAARIVNRPPPSIPEMHLTEEMVHEAAAFVGLYVNVILSTFNNIVKKRDAKVFFRIALYLWLISLISGFVDLRTLAYSSLVVILTVPALYEKYEDCIDRYFKLLHMEVQMYERVYTRCFSKYFIRTNKWVLDMKKLLVDT